MLEKNLFSKVVSFLYVIFIAVSTIYYLHLLGIPIETIPYETIPYETIPYETISEHLPINELMIILALIVLFITTPIQSVIYYILKKVIFGNKVKVQLFFLNLRKKYYLYLINNKTQRLKKLHLLYKEKIKELDILFSKDINLLLKTFTFINITTIIYYINQLILTENKFFISLFFFIILFYFINIKLLPKKINDSQININYSFKSMLPFFISGFFVSLISLIIISNQIENINNNKVIDMNYLKLITIFITFTSISIFIKILSRKKYFIDKRKALSRLNIIKIEKELNQIKLLLSETTSKYKNYKYVLSKIDNKNVNKMIEEDITPFLRATIINEYSNSTETLNKIKKEIELENLENNKKAETFSIYILNIPLIATLIFFIFSAFYNEKIEDFKLLNPLVKNYLDITDYLVPKLLFNKEKNTTIKVIYAGQTKDKIFFYRIEDMKTIFNEYKTKFPTNIYKSICIDKSNSISLFKFNILNNLFFNTSPLNTDFYYLDSNLKYKLNLDKKFSNFRKNIDFINKKNIEVLPYCYEEYISKKKENNFLQNEEKIVYKKVNNNKKTNIDEKTFKLYVNAYPKDSSIKIMNIKSKFEQGIKLKSGTYRVLLEREGYISKEITINLYSNKTISYKLEKTSSIIKDKIYIQIENKNINEIE